MPPSPTPIDEEIDFVREIAGEGSFEFITTLIDNLNDAQWSRAQDLITAWTDYAPGSVMELVNGGREGVNEKDQDALMDICLLYTSDAADERSSVDLGGRRIIK